MRRAGGFLLAGVVIAAGCGPDLPDIDHVPNATLGRWTEDGTFRAFRSHEDVTLEPGSQGGFHISIDLRLSHFLEPTARADDDEVRVKLSAREDVNGRLITNSTQATTLTPAQETSDVEMRLESRRTLFLCPAPLGLVLYDIPVRLAAEVTSSAQEADAEVTIVLRCPAGEKESTCRHLCRGS